MGPLLFCLNHYNDIDHIVPVIWKSLEKGAKCHVIFLNPFRSFHSDPRIEVLKKNPNFSSSLITSTLNTKLLKFVFKPYPQRKIPIINRLIRKVMRPLLVERASKFLRELSPIAVVFEWGGWGTRGRLEILEATRRLNIRSVCLPHGLNIYMNHDLNPSLTKVLANGKLIRKKNDIYSAYIFQSEYHKELDIRLGLDSSKAFAMGSARFSPEWHIINMKIHLDFSIPSSNNKIKVCFMLPHWNYNVNKEITCQLINDILDMENVFLTIKKHTRGNDEIPEVVKQKLSKKKDSSFVSIDEPSVSLIRWSDVVINFGSSIGIEVIQQKKVLINPTFCHTNQTIFEHFSVGLETASIIKTLEAVAGHADIDDNKNSWLDLEKVVIYGGRDSHDILDSYCKLICNL